MPEGLEAVVRPWIETFQSRSSLDLRPLWLSPGAAGGWEAALSDPWGGRHRPDWQARGLLIWPRGGRWRRLRLTLRCPEAWRSRAGVQARLVLSWWADAVVLRVDGAVVHEGDLFDTACRWLLPARWWQGRPLELELELRSPRHDDGALIESRLELEPTDPADPEGVLLGTALELVALRQPAELAAALGPWDPADPPAAQLARALASGPLARLRQSAEAVAPPPAPGPDFHVLGHAHLDLAWLWPVADTWRAAERTFASALALMERHPQLHFAHSTPALYAWIEQHRPALFAAIRRAMQQGRWEPINGPWVETDCVLVATASLLRQFQEGQHYSRSRFPEWRHELCWLPDSFGFGAGLPAVARATGVRWFCTHKLAWNATNPFPHRLFRWRSRCGSELLALMTAPIGTGGDPVAMESYRQQWRRGSGVEQALWLPGVGDHGGGPTAEMLEQLELWQQQPLAGPQRHGSLRSYLEPLEPLEPQLPVWRDELYLELHRGCSTSRPDQKRHNRSLERLLREAEVARALLWVEDRTGAARGAEPHGPDVAGGDDPVDWRPLLFQQFHDILPGTSIPEVFEQAEPQWRQARRQASRQRDRALAAWLGSRPNPAAAGTQPWWLVQFQPHPREPLCLRLPRGRWWLGHQELPVQLASGGSWVQLPAPQGLDALPLQRLLPGGAPAGSPGMASAEPGPEINAPVRIAPLPDGQGWRLDNSLVVVELGPAGVRQLWGADGLPQLAAPLEWRRWRDQGEFWDAWDIAADFREHPLPLEWTSPAQLEEAGPLCVRAVWRGQCGRSALRLDVQLRAGSPWLELTLSVDWRQRHELLRLELPLAQPAVRIAADGSGGVLERPAEPATARERTRWELPAISWVASQAAGGGLAVLLDGPQGVSGTAQRLGVSLLRGPTWPDPSADNGWQRLRLALMPCRGGWRQAGVVRQAVRFREPLWLRPAAPSQGPSLGAARVPLDLGHADLQLLALRPDPQPGVLQLSVQNLGPSRHQLALPPGWRLLERCDGLGEPLPASALPAGDRALLAPWQLGFWRIAAAGPGS